MGDVGHINPNGIYTYDQLEKILGISKRTLSYFVEKKELIPIVFGNKYRFLGSEVLRFLQEKMKEGKDVEKDTDKAIVPQVAI